MEDEVVREILGAIKDSMKELRESQKEIQKDIGDIKITQAEQHITLVDHTKRSTANEEEIKLVREHFESQIAPIKRDIWKAKGALGFLGLLLTVVTILALLHKI